jgi:hypothetical protein
VFCRQPTQVPFALSQSGAAPAHCEVFVGEHWPQVPSLWQAGAPGWPLQSPSVAHATQTPLVAQVGVRAGQLPFWRQPTQIPSAVSQNSDEPHWTVLLDEHWPQWPPGWQAGVPMCPAQPPSLLQATQV